MRSLIIGGGAVSEMFHIPAAIKALGAENIYVAEFSESQRQKLAHAFPGVKVIENYTQVLSQSDFAIIATPPHTHIEIMQACTQKAIPFLCEKPVSFSAASLQEIVDSCKKNDLVTGVCHTYRFFPNRLEVRQMIQDGFFGSSPEIEILEGDATTWSPVTGYNFRKDITPGGVLLDGGIHSLDFLVWCLGLPTVTKYYDDSLGGLESNLRLSLTFPSSATAFFRLSRTCSLPNTIKVSGNGHLAELGIFDFSSLKIDQKLVSVAEKYPKEASDWSDIAETQLNDFIASVQEKRPPRCTVGEASQSIGIIENSYRMKSQRKLPEALPLPGLTF